MRREEQKYIRNDMILIVSLCVIAIVLSIFIYTGRSETKLAAEVLVDGELREKVILMDKQYEEITVDAGNVVCIDNGHVYMKSADCPDGLCVKQGEIDKANESIICLPHKVVVRLVSVSGETEDDGLDVMPR